ncbi:MAG TPA: helix-turn-helix transcriptional regulator [Rhabdochlamydiaceae bacterium]|nr:helix-turn-helix transcriptional regulator [Rhabdochlamydiaceae bacterium]
MSDKNKFTLHLGELFFLKRKQRDLTQQEIASKLNITRAAISNIETGKCSPTLENTLLLMLFLKINIADIDQLARRYLK